MPQLNEYLTLGTWEDSRYTPYKKMIKFSNKAKVFSVSLAIIAVTAFSIYFHLLGKDRVFPHLYYLPILMLVVFWGTLGWYLCVLFALSLPIIHIASGIDVPVLDDIIRTLVMCIVSGFVAANVLTRKRTEQALRKSEEKYRIIVENQTDLIVKVNSEGEILFASPSYCKMFGKTEQELLGKKSMPMVHEEDLESTLKAMENCYRPPYIAYLEQHAMTAEGWKWLAWAGNGVLDENSNVTAIVGVGRDITKRKLAEEQLEASLKEKKMLLQEIHHRVKNNMQVIAGLLKLQARRVKGEEMKQALEVSQSRIRAMATVHEILYQSENLSEIDLKKYVPKMVNLIHQTFKQKRAVDLNMHIEDITLSINQAVPFSLVINELTSNSFKYAFPEAHKVKGEIEITVRLSGENEIELLVSDNGQSIPENIDYRNTETLGLQLVTGLVESQLEGTVSLNREMGTEFLIRFKKKSQYMEVKLCNKPIICVLCGFLFLNSFMILFSGELEADET